MTLESLEKLRGLIEKSRDEYVQGNVSYNVGFNEIADEIECEIDEKYVKLPTDFDGVPIRPGDELEYRIDDLTDEHGESVGAVEGRITVAYVAFDDDGCVAVQDEDEFDTPPMFFCDYCGGDIKYRHAEPDRLKERVMEFAECAENGRYCNALVDELCADIREMAGKGEL